VIEASRATGDWVKLASASNPPTESA
jgi:hypothetical protein